MSAMNRLIDTFERLMVAVTYAEAGDQVTALKVMQEKSTRKRKRTGMKVRKHDKQRPVLRV